jgi:hypothetical protein
MKLNQWLFCGLVFIQSCHSVTYNPDSATLKASDTAEAPTRTDTIAKNAAAISYKTHLKDTTYASGNFILFLQPDDARYVELDKGSEGNAGDADSDFGVGINATQDSLKKSDRYKNIKVLTSAHRYIFIKDCKDCPLIIDRDSVNYGFIISVNGKTISKSYNSVHGGDYLGELDEYFLTH